MNLKVIMRLTFFCLILSICLAAGCTKTTDETTPVPPSSKQLILVITDSSKAFKGNLYYFERDSSESAWIKSKDKVSIALGRNGLGWGRGLHNLPNRVDLPIKEEGDGRSPSGIFRLSHVFGYNPADQMINLKMPYIHIMEMIECIDDVSSDNYNKIVSRDELEKLGHVDWQSSEKMRYVGVDYELGVVVAHNKDPIKKGSGSCIFLHNWSNPNVTTAGCTVMDPFNMKEIVYWLDEVKNPILIQLTQELYIELFKKWELPELNKIANKK